MDFDRILSCEFIKANFGRLPKESLKKLDNYKDDPYVYFFICTEDESHYWGVYVTPIDRCEDIDRIFSGLYFEHCDTAGFHGTPENSLKILTKQLEEYTKQEQEISAELDLYCRKRSSTSTPATASFLSWSFSQASRKRHDLPQKLHSCRLGSQ